MARGGQGEGAVEQRQRPRKKGFLVCCFGSSMKKCFALTKTFGLTLFACAPWHRPPNLATPFPSHSTPSAAKRPGAQRRGKRGALRREADFTWTERGGEGVRWGPTSPLLPSPSGEEALLASTGVPAGARGLRAR